MNKKTWTLSRRDVLRGIGASLALPFLDAMVPGGTRMARAATSITPTRFMAVYFPHGLQPNLFWPSGNGPGFTLPTMLQSLTPYAQDLTFVRGLNNKPGDVYPAGKDEGDGIHARHTGSFLTATQLRPTQSASQVSNGISIDQLMSQKIGASDPIASLALGVQGGNINTIGEDDFSSVYMNNISWSSATAHPTLTTSPQALFDRLTGSIKAPTGTPVDPAVQARQQFECRVMDSINAEAKALSSRLGKDDRTTLDQFLTGVAELEKRCAAATPTPTPVSQCTPPTRPAAGIGTYQNDLDLMLDLSVLAFQCNLTRVCTLMFSGAFGYRDFKFLNAGSTDPHDMTHNSGESANWTKVTTWTFERYAHLLGKLKAVQEGGSTLLDNSIIYIGSEFGNGATHDSTDLACIVAGKAGGLYKPGRYVRLSNQTPRANLYLGFAQDMGLPGVTAFGDSTGTLTTLRG